MVIGSSEEKVSYNCVAPFVCVGKFVFLRDRKAKPRSIIVGRLNFASTPIVVSNMPSQHHQRRTFITMPSWLEGINDLVDDTIVGSEISEVSALHSQEQGCLSLRSGDHRIR